VNRKILVVDDMPDVLAEVRHILEDRYVVHTARSGQDALEQCRTRGPFAAVVTDQGMPGMSGTELLRHMQKGWPDTTRIIMTGYADLEFAIAALHEGAIYRFLQKPVRSADLEDAMESGVERFHRLEEERLLTEQLQFSRESLLTLTHSLEHRLAEQLGRMRGLQRFSLRLGEVETLEDLAELTARCAAKLLGGRKTRVQLDGLDAGTEATWSTSDELPQEMHQEPIKTLEGEVGLIEVSEHGPVGEGLSASDREVLTSLACTAGIAARAQLSRRERDVAHDATIHALASLAENRDDETSRHLERVSRYCGVVAQALRAGGRHVEVLTDDFVKDLTTSAPLHDIGKVGIPDSILLKPGPLDEAEWEVMRRHTTIGADTLRHVIEASGEQSYLRMGHEIAWAHHERWDGSGYPRGLRGAEIPLSARIVALVDCYDALTSWRPYKGPWSHDESVAYILEQRGAQFDPDIVDAFRVCAAEFDGIRCEHADSPEELQAKWVA
jgi:response regulator RpfG family c-di-GMP phosphodiesterase